MRGELAAGLARALGSAVRATQSVTGGDINAAHRVELADGRRVFVKENRSAPRGMFAAEAEGLDWLRECHELRVPEIFHVGDDHLVLEWIEPGRRQASFDEELGRSLAALHRNGAPSFGHVRDNFIGRLPQANEAATDWPTFYRERRLRPMLELARSVLGSRTFALFDRLFSRLGALVGPAEPPARLHGDLWGGNLHTTPEGRPCLIDPAVYGGHREMDLSMMRLFGGFGPRVFAAYTEAYPLAPGHEERVGLYQLYPLLVHVNLFGQSYAGAVRAELERYL